MPQHFHRLENALKRANEFIDVGKKLEALEILCDVLRSRKHRTWQNNHQEIMFKYLELCVELRKSYVAKEGIYQYKIICQQTQIKSFEDIVRRYLELAEERAEEAKSVAQAATVDVDDLDNAQTPENILLSAVSSEDTQDRTDRVVLLPWVKFLWESYRQCLDLLKNNARTEHLYHKVAQKAFQFCIKFNRKTEFRKLCDNLHAHLDILKKQQQQLTQAQPTTHNIQNIINLSNAESQDLHLQTRLLQLDCAITMELWQEAYKATDDIRRFNLMNLSKKPLKPSLMASYYQRLALVFQKANCPLFHGAALFRHFMLMKDLRKNIKEDELAKMASRVVAATLSIPIPPTRSDIDKLVDTEENVVENHQRNLASLLGLTSSIPSRMTLIRDLKRMGVLPYAYEEMQHLYEYLEVDFHPLTLCIKVDKIINFMENHEYTELQSYVAPLKDVSVVRLLKEISQVYHSMQFKRLLQLCPFADNVYLEKMIVDAARRNDLQVRVDHRAKALHFGLGARLYQAEEVTEGPHLQTMPSAQLRTQLVTLYGSLQRTRALLDSQKLTTDKVTFRTKMMNEYERRKDKEHFAILERQDQIEERKEELEQKSHQQQEAERKALEDKQNLLRVQEEERMKREARERQLRVEEKEQEELKRRMAMDTIEQIKRTEVGQRLLETLGEDGLADLKVDEIKSKQWEQLEKERKELIQKQQKVERKFDHIERAKRLEEISLLEAQYEQEKIEARQIFEEAERERISELISERNLALQHRERLARMKPTAELFANKIKGARQDEFEHRLTEWENKVSIEKRNRLEKRRRERIENRRREYLMQKRKAEKEAEEARKREEMAELKRKKEEERRLLDEKAAKQREKELEIERRLQEEQDRRRDQETDRAPAQSKPSEDSWRSPDKRPVPPGRERDSMGHGRGSNEPGFGPRSSHDTPRGAYQAPKGQDRPEEKQFNWRNSPREPEREQAEPRRRPQPLPEQEERGSWREQDRDQRGPRDHDRPPPRRMDDRPRPAGRYPSDQPGGNEHQGPPARRYASDGQRTGGGWREGDRDRERDRDRGDRERDRDRGDRERDRDRDQGPRHGDQRRDDRAPRREEEWRSNKPQEEHDDGDGSWRVVKKSDRSTGGGPGGRRLPSSDTDNWRGGSAKKN